MFDYMLIAYFLTGLLGVLAHFFKKKIKGQTIHDIRNWFVAHFKDTTLSLILYIVSFAMLITTGDVSFISSFMSGYMCDSIFSREDKNGEV